MQSGEPIQGTQSQAKSSRLTDKPGSNIRKGGRLSMNVKERLSSVLKLDSLIDCKIAQYDKARKAEFYSEKAKKLSAEIDRDIDRLADEKKEIMRMIDNTVELTPIEIEVLYKHFLEGMTYEKIAAEKYYAKVSVYRICTQAVDKMQAQWGNTYAFHECTPLADVTV